MHDAINSFRLAILAGLGHAPDAIEPGCLHRFATNDKHADAAGWCKLFDDMQGGVYGCHRQGISETWCAGKRATMTPQQRVALARQVAVANGGPKTRFATQSCGASVCRSCLVTP
jgi:putative DNA primase/helicase